MQKEIERKKYHNNYYGLLPVTGTSKTDKMNAGN